jgi:hypothetical protein
MVFILRSERAPTRVVRETDEGGVARTFWLWRDGAWVVATRRATGEISHACCPTLDVMIEPGENVAIVRVVHPPLTATIPAPAPTAFDGTQHAISAVIPVSPKIGELDVVGVHGLDEADPKRRVSNE